MKITFSNLIFYSCITFIFSFISVHCYSQPSKKADSLFNALKSAKNDTALCKLYLEIGNTIENANPDSALKWYEKSLEHASSCNLKSWQAKSIRYIGSFNSDQGNYPMAITDFKKSLKLYKELGDIHGISQCYNSLGIAYYYQSDYPKAIEHFQKSLKICEKRGDKQGMSQCYNNIGNVYSDQGNYEQTIEYYQKSLKLDEELGEKRGMSACYVNIGNVYGAMNNYSLAIEYFQKSLKICEELGDKKSISYCYGNIGNVYKNQGNYSAAIKYFQFSLKICEEIGDKNGVSLVYGNLAALHIKLRKYSEAVQYALKGLAVANEIGTLYLQRENYMHLSEAYDSLKNYRQAYLYFRLFKQINDSMFNHESSKQLKEAEARYQSEKKQIEIDKLCKEKALQAETIARKNAENKKQRIIIFSVILVLLIILVFSVIISRMFFEKKKANVLLAQQNVEIKQQKEEIETQRDEIESQRNEIAVQRDIVTEQKEHIERLFADQTDSILYAERIQKAVLPDIEVMLSPKSQDSSPKPQVLEFGTWNSSAMLTTGLGFEAFVLFKPKNIVSGDFYWMAKRGEHLLIAVADCTGHGVPGAFMSMLGIAFLNEIVAHENIRTAGQVLDELRQSVINSLQQRGVFGEQNDGMDISMVDLHPGSLQLQFAGANNPLYIVETGGSPVSTIRETRPDNMPIAILENMIPFTNHIIQVKKGDILYLFSDGFEDQLGGPKGKKFLTKSFKNLISEICLKSMHEQKEILDKTLENWKGNHEQTDDITVIGIKI